MPPRVAINPLKFVSFSDSDIPPEIEDQNFPGLHKLMTMRRIPGFFDYEDEVNSQCSEFGLPVGNYRFSRICVIY